MLKKVRLKARHDFKLKVGEEYLLYVDMISFEDGTLKGTVLRAKALDECWDRS